MIELDFKETNLYKTGLQYKEWGELLMNPKTRLSDLVAYGLKHDVELQIRMAPNDEEAAPDPEAGAGAGQEPTGD